MEEHDLMLVSEVAAALRTSKMSIYRAITKGDLAAIRVGRSYRVRREVFQAFMERGGSQ
jgi:excisionase family DNA binding protein